MGEGNFPINRISLAQLKYRLFEIWKAQNTFNGLFNNAFENFEQNINTWENSVRESVSGMR
jgi:hypothetical protein